MKCQDQAKTLVSPTIQSHFQAGVYRDWCNEQIGVVIVAYSAHTCHLW